MPGNLTPRLASPKLADGYEVRVFPLRYVSPSEMAKLLTPYAKPTAFINIDTARSMLVLAGTASELSNYAQTIEIFDVDWLKGMSIGVFNLQRVEVATLMPELEKIFGATGDLAQRMLLPSMYSLYRDGLLPDDVRILGTARSELDDARFRASVAEALAKRVAGVSISVIGWIVPVTKARPSCSSTT